MLHYTVSKEIEMAHASHFRSELAGLVNACPAFPVMGGK